MLMPGSKKKKAAGQKRPRPIPLLPTSPHLKQQKQQQQQQHGMLPKTADDLQRQQQQHQQQREHQHQHLTKKKKAKEEDKDAGLGLGAWIMLPGTERDIFVDRCRKEIAPLLGIVPAAGEGVEEDAAKPRVESDGSNPSSTKSQDKNKQEKKRPKPRVKVFSAKEGTAAHKYARKFICIGINEVTRALEKGQLSLLFICRDVKPPRLVEHIAVLAALRGVPFFVLPKATTSLGRSFGLQLVAALGFRANEGTAEGSAQREKGDEGVRVDEMEEDVVSGVQNRLQSFQAFLLAKREYVNGEEGLVVKKKEKGGRERRV